jgi:murein DD-endopeptidase MepM/ murein hydrolase activator NlpD
MAAPRQPVQVAAANPTPTPAATPAAAATTPAPQTNVAAAAPRNTDVDAPSPNGTSFRWPVQGRIIENFGPRPGGERNDGINLAVAAGTEIHAAEAGVVIYAGNEIPGYGNLILVRHADNWVTAYAHASSIMVQRDQTVRRGETIGLVGQTGSVSSPQLHFELRRGSTPVNPMDYLN